MSNDKPDTSAFCSHPIYTNYLVYSDGRVFSVKSNKFMKPKMWGAPGRQYPAYSLRHKGKVVQRKIGVMVLEAFVSARPIGMEAAHIDGNKANNSLSNMKWCTKAENEADKKRHGTAPIGANQSNAKLTDAQVLEIRRRSSEAHKALAKEFGVHFDHIGSIINRRSWRHLK